MLGVDGCDPLLPVAGGDVDIDGSVEVGGDVVVVGVDGVEDVGVLGGKATGGAGLDGAGGGAATEIPKVAGPTVPPAPSATVNVKP